MQCAHLARVIPSCKISGNSTQLNSWIQRSGDVHIQIMDIDSSLLLTVKKILIGRTVSQFEFG